MEWRGIFWALTAVTVVMAVGAVALVGETLSRERRTVGSGAAMARSLLAVTADRGFLMPALAVAFAFGSLFGYVAAALAVSSAVSARLVSRVRPYRLLVVWLRCCWAPRRF